MEDAPDVNYNWPILPATPREEEMVAKSTSNYLGFGTLSARFCIDRDEVDEVSKPENYAHPDLCNKQPYDLRVYNSSRQVVGTVGVPQGVTQRLGGWHEFIVLTRTTLSNDTYDAQ